MTTENKVFNVYSMFSEISGLWDGDVDKKAQRSIENITLRITSGGMNMVKHE